MSSMSVISRSRTPRLRASERRPFFPIEANDDDLDWAGSNERWSSRDGDGRRRSRHQRAGSPLILGGHGVSLRIEKGTLLIRVGFTHYPQEREVLHFFKGDLELPTRIIMLDGSGSLSFDVLAWLAEQGVSLIRVDYQGDVITVIGDAGSAFDAVKVAWQDKVRETPELRIAFACDLIAKKVRATLRTLEKAVPPSAARDIAVRRAEATIARLDARAVKSVSDVLMIEAGAAARYFSAWRGLPIRWKGTSRHPVPESWLAAGSRRTVRDSRFATNRNATHPVNAMLNYGYGVLHSQVRIEAISEGYDPRRGILHESRADSQAFVLDLMEARRPDVDAAILNFVGLNAFTASDFAISAMGVCRLAPQLARRVAALVEP